MACVENLIHASGHDRRISRRLFHVTCGKCHAAIEYGRGTEWSVVSELANEHWKACPRKPHARPPRMPRTPTSPPDATIVLSPPVTARQHGSLNPAVEPVTVGFPNGTWIASGCERKRRTLEQRKRELEQDEYAKNVTMKSVVCGGCRKEISLDKRSKYYPGLWLKHRGKCPIIGKLERAKASLNAPQGPNSTRGVPSGAVPGLGHEERCEGYGAAAATRQMYDSEDLSSEDGDDDEDLLFQESFPTLNSAFYWSERSNNHREEWTYRYATEDEITTNFFRGQDEPYVRLAHLDLWSGGRCETSRCVMTSRVERANSRPDGLGSAEVLSEPVPPHALLWYNNPCTP